MEPDKNGPGSHAMLDRYIHNYMKRRRLTTAAAVFAKEAQITDETVAVNGLLKDWWAMFYDTYSSRMRNRHEEFSSLSNPQTQTPMNQQLTRETFQTPLPSPFSSQEVNSPFIMIPRGGPLTNFIDGSPQTPTISLSPAEIESFFSELSSPEGQDARNSSGTFSNGSQEGQKAFNNK